MLCAFIAEAEITRVSEPAEMPVICHVATAVPVDKLPMLTVGVFTEK